jgi:hypothetical protein
MKLCTKCNIEKSLDDFYDRITSPDKKRNSCKTCMRKHKIIYNKQYRLLNKIKINKANKVYKIQNKEKIRKQQSIKLMTDINYKLASNLRARLSMVVSHNYKSGSAVKDLGCSIKEFKIYIESKFTDEMSWENYGRNGWYLDHIVPLSSFDLTDREQLLKACHYTNIQPLLAFDNMSKGNKICAE